MIVATWADTNDLSWQTIGPYSWRQTSFPVASVVGLKAKRVLNVPLMAKRVLYVNLKGGLSVAYEKQDFAMYQGDSKYIVFTVEGAESIDITNVTWVLTPHRKTEVALRKTTADDISIVNGEIRVKLNPIDTQSLTGIFEHEVQIVDIYNNVSTVLSGVVSIKPDKAKLN